MSSLQLNTGKLRLPSANDVLLVNFLNGFVRQKNDDIYLLRDKTKNDQLVELSKYYFVKEITRSKHGKILMLECEEELFALKISFHEQHFKTEVSALTAIQGMKLLF
jgi:hypothetical protein